MSNDIPMEVISIEDGWLNLFEPHYHLRLWKPWCAYIEVYQCGQRVATFIKRCWTYEKAIDTTDALIDDLFGVKP